MEAVGCGSHREAMDASIKSIVLHAPHAKNLISVLGLVIYPEQGINLSPKDVGEMYQVVYSIFKISLVMFVKVVDIQ